MQNTRTIRSLKSITYDYLVNRLEYAVLISIFDTEDTYCFITNKSIKKYLHHKERQLLGCVKLNFLDLEQFYSHPDQIKSDQIKNKILQEAFDKLEPDNCYEFVPKNSNSDDYEYEFKKIECKNCE